MEAPVAHPESAEITAVARPDAGAILDGVVVDGTKASLRRRQPGEAAPYPMDTSEVLDALTAERQDGAPIAVSFRKLVPWIKVGERATHYLHPYPAKLLPHIAHFFLAAKSLAGPRATVLDPFGGSGTVALETLLSGRRAVYAEVNPFACLVTRAKTRLLSVGSFEDAFARTVARFSSSTRVDAPDVVNAGLWYDEGTFACLAALRWAVAGERDAVSRDLLEVTFSVVAKKSSRADPRFAVPVRRKESVLGASAKPSLEEARADVMAALECQFAANLRRIEDLRSMAGGWSEAAFAGPDARSVCEPSRDGTARPRVPMADGSVDMIITSPPYGSAQKYVRATSLSLCWLGLAAPGRLSELEQRTIGREHIRKAQAGAWNEDPVGLGADAFLHRVAVVNSSRAAITATYLKEMDAAVAEMVRVLKPGGHVVLVMGENQVCGMRFESTSFLTQMFAARGCGLLLHLEDGIPQRGLMTKRASTAAVIAKEAVLLFRKGRRA